MLLRNLTIAFACGILTLSSCVSQKKNNSKEKETNMELKNEQDSVGYALGVNIGTQIKGQFKDVDVETIVQGIRETYAEKATINNDQAGPIIQKYMQGVQARAGAENLKAGQDFLAENGQRKGITTTASGLQYEVITEGSGEKPTANDQVKVHYHGTLIDGTVFDSSVNRGEPATFGVGQVIPGWTEALQLMNTGSKWKIFLPSNIAYGERGAGGQIGPNAALIFEVELLDIVK